MNNLPLQVKNTLLEFLLSQERLIRNYDKEKSFEMAYLVRWSMLEKIVKVIASEYRRKQLIISLREWLEFAENSNNKRITIMGFFEAKENEKQVDNSLFVERYRPTRLEDYVGNEHLKGCSQV